MGSDNVIVITTPNPIIEVYCSELVGKSASGGVDNTMMHKTIDLMVWAELIYHQLRAIHLNDGVWGGNTDYIS